MSVGDEPFCLNFRYSSAAVENKAINPKRRKVKTGIEGRFLVNKYFFSHILLSKQGNCFFAIGFIVLGFCVYFDIRFDTGCP